MTDFLDYAERNGFWLFPCIKGTKVPALKWTRDSSNDQSQWSQWLAEDRNLAINCAKSDIIEIDVDSSKVSQYEASQAYHAICRTWGLAESPAALTYSARGGWHIAFRRPAEFEATSLHAGKTLVKVSDLRPLAPGEKDGEVIGFKNRGYCMAPGSILDVDGVLLPYQIMPDAPPPHACPSKLIEDIYLAPVIAQPGGATGMSDAGDLAELVAVLDSYGEFDTEPDWWKYMGAIKLALGDTADGILVAEQMTWHEASDDLMMKKWNALATVDTGGRFCRVGSMIHRYRELTGQDFKVRTRRKTTTEMFGGLPAVNAPPLVPVPPPPGSPAVPPEGTTALVGRLRQQLAPPEYSEIEIADRFANAYASNISFVTLRKTWIYWTGKRWQTDQTGYVANLARLHCREESALCAQTPKQTDAQARAVCTNKTVNAVLQLACIDQRIASTPDRWDQDIWLLGTPDGIVDLRTGTLRAARPEDHVTKSTAVSPGQSCPQWLAFLHRATGGDVEMQSYLQRFCGYALTGSTKEQSLQFAYGPGGSGKGTLMHAVSKILKDYHRTTAIATLTASGSFDRHPTEIADLKGARLVTCSETERNREWAESRIKQLTGGDEISARYMGKDFFNFEPTFKLLISGNYKPAMRPDTAMQRRFQLIPFETVIPEGERDNNLGDKLELEWPGILGWMIEGTTKWRQHGLRPPAAVLDATHVYMTEESENAISTWLTENCDRTSNAQTKLGDLYVDYRQFALAAGEEKTFSREQFGKELRSCNFKVERIHAGRFVFGLALRPKAVPLPPLPPLPLPALVHAL